MSILLSFIAGLFAALSLPYAGWADFVWDLTPWTFPILSLSVYGLFLRLQSSNTRKAYFIHASCWAFGYFVMGLNWVGNALLIEDNPFVWVWPFALVGLPAILALFWGSIFALGRPCLVNRPLPLQILTFMALFMTADLARGFLFTGFPWNGLGTYWTEILPILQVTSAIGLTGLSLLTLFWGMALAATLTRHLPLRHPLTLAAIVTLALATIYGLHRLQPIAPSGKTLQVVLVQANVPQSERWNPDLWVEHFYRHIGLSERPIGVKEQPTVIIWPETILAPTFIEAPAVKRAITQLLRTYPTESVLISGAFHGVGTSYYNGLFLYDRAGTPQSLYNKHHLVPFGEYIPYQAWIPLRPVARFEGLTPGPGPRTIDLPGLPPARPLICYEAIFPYMLTTNPLDEQWILNVTNDAWYGNSPGPRQHLAQARVRAIERGLPLARVAVTGLSAAFDSRGRVLASAAYNTPAAVVAQLPIAETKQATIYMKLPIQDLFPFSFIALLLCTTIFWRYRKS